MSRQKPRIMVVDRAGERSQRGMRPASVETPNTAQDSLYGSVLEGSKYEDISSIYSVDYISNIHGGGTNDPADDRGGRGLHPENWMPFPSAYRRRISQSFPA